MVKSSDYVPERGDVIWLTFDPQAGHEQAGRRPALVLSPAAYNGKVGLAILCPITSQIKGYPFEVSIPQGLPIEGVILADQVKNLDWEVRETELIFQLPSQVVNEVLKKIHLLLSVES
ncbi:MAG: endoribonuclease MazF [Anaerolineales bacterium]